MQQYLLKKRRRKSLFVLSPAIPMATLFGGSALFYFFFSPSPMPEMQEVKVTVPGAYDMENRHRGQDGSLVFACPASFHVWTAMKRNELKGRSLSSSLSPIPSFCLPIYKSFTYIINASYTCMHILSTYILCVVHILYTRVPYTYII